MKYACLLLLNKKIKIKKLLLNPLTKDKIENKNPHTKKIYE
jgi:hypothetical protein